MPAHSGFNNPDEYCASLSVNLDLPFKSLASVFIKKLDHLTWALVQLTLPLSFHFCSHPDVLQGCKTARPSGEKVTGWRNLFAAGTSMWS